MTCKPSVIARLESMGVKVIQGGKDWYEADLKARELMEVGGTNIYLPPFDHPLVVEGHSSLIPEISEQLVEQGEERKMTAISVSVGGGGLLAGILLGLKNGTEADKKGKFLPSCFTIPTTNYFFLCPSFSRRNSQRNTRMCISRSITQIIIFNSYTNSQIRKIK